MTLQKGDVVVRIYKGVPTGMLFYVTGDKAPNGEIMLLRVTCVPLMAWKVSFPARQLTKVGHISKELVWKDNTLPQKDMADFTDAVLAAYQGGVRVVLF